MLAPVLEPSLQYFIEILLQEVTEMLFHHKISEKSTLGE